MSAFEYLSVYISIILGLAVVHLLGGISLILDQRVRARLNWIHLAWVFNMFTLIMWVWWANWQLNDVPVFSRVHFSSMVLFSVVLYLMCALLFPVRGNEIEDFYEQFEINRVQFFWLGEALVLAAALKGHVDRSVLGEADQFSRFVMLTVLGVCFFVGTRTSDRRFHGILAVTFPVLILYWIAIE